jgi:hypothetical protein
MVQVIKNVALAGLYLEIWNLTNTGKILSSPETTAYPTVPTRHEEHWKGGRQPIEFLAGAGGIEPPNG